MSSRDVPLGNITSIGFETDSGKALANAANASGLLSVSIALCSEEGTCSLRNMAAVMYPSMSVSEDEGFMMQRSFSSSNTKCR